MLKNTIKTAVRAFPDKKNFRCATIQCQINRNFFECKIKHAKNAWRKNSAFLQQVWIARHIISCLFNEFKFHCRNKVIKTDDIITPYCVLMPLQCCRHLLALTRLQSDADATDKSFYGHRQHLLPGKIPYFETIVILSLPNFTEERKLISSTKL